MPLHVPIGIFSLRQQGQAVKQGYSFLHFNVATFIKGKHHDPILTTFCGYTISEIESISDTQTNMLSGIAQERKVRSKIR